MGNMLTYKQNEMINDGKIDAFDVDCDDDDDDDDDFKNVKSVTSSTVEINDDYVDSFRIKQSHNEDEEYKKLCEIYTKNCFGRIWVVRKRVDSNNPSAKTSNNKSLIKYYQMKQLNLDSNVVDYSYAIDKGNLLQLVNKHQNIVSYVDSYQELNKIYFIMDYCCYAGTLRERIEFQLNKRIHQSSNSSTSIYFNENLIWYWFTQMLNGLNYIHSQYIYHQDLKPDNVYIDSISGQCKLGDLSLINYNYKNFFKLSNINNYYSLYYKPPEFRFNVKNECEDDDESDDNDEQFRQEYNESSEKSDIFAFGCIIYELVNLERAVKNPFSKELAIVIDSNLYSSDLIGLIEQLLCTDMQTRPNCDYLYELECVKSRLDVDYSEYYRQQCIPTLNLQINYGSLGENYKKNITKIGLDGDYKPVSLISLKYNKNLILIALNKHLNESIKSQSKIVVYSEFGDLLIEFNAFIKDSLTKQYELFNFKIYSMCIDELNSHIYLSTDRLGVIRLKYIINSNSYNLLFDKLFDFNGKITPKIIHLCENAFSEPYKKLLLLTDSLRNRLLSITFDINNGSEAASGSSSDSTKQKFTINWQITVNSVIFQIFNTKTEIICLLNDYLTINVYYLNTGLFKRDNKHKLNKYNPDSIQPLCMDSDYNLYSTDGYKLYSINSSTFDVYNTIDTLETSTISMSLIDSSSNGKQRKPLFSSILFMNILSNGKLVLLKDVVQTDNSVLFILKPVFNINDLIDS